MYPHRWVDSDNPDPMLPVTWYQVCSKCGADQQDGYGRVIGDTCPTPTSPSWISRLLNKVLK